MCRIREKTLSFLLIISLLIVIVGFANVDTTHAAKKVHLKKNSISLVAGKTFQQKLINKNGKTIKATKVKWKSKKTSVAKINKKGKITAVNAGKTKMTAKYKGKTYKFSVKVNKKKIIKKKTYYIKVAQDTYNLSVNQVVTIKATNNDDIGSSGYTIYDSSDCIDVLDRTSTYPNSNETVENVKIKALKPGTATIRFEVGESPMVTKKVTINVTMPLNIKTPTVPATFNAFLKSGNSSMLVTTCTVNKITFEKTYFESSNEFAVKMRIFGKKEYDALMGDSPCYIDYKLYDSDGYMINSGRFVENVNTGEKFEDYVYLNTDLKPGNYTLKLFDVVVVV